MNKKKEIKKDKTDKAAEVLEGLSTPQDLKNFLHSMQEKMTEEVSAPIYVLSGMNYIMTSPNIYSLLNEETKELARDIWLRLQSSGLQLRRPPLLFGE